MITMPIELYTDGSCQRNPGAGGYAYIIRYWELPPDSDMPKERQLEHSEGYRLTTNNRMEVMAAIAGLRDIITKIRNGTFEGAFQVNVFADSEYFCNSINHRWIQNWEQNGWMTSGYKSSKPAPVKNKDLWQAVIEIQNQLKDMNIILTISHVKGHSGHEFNERADLLAGQASIGNNFLIDEVYERTMTVYNKR